MALEVAVEVALVGEAELAHKLLEALVGVHERHLQFNDCVVVNYLLGILSACALAYGVQVACRDLQCIGVVLHRALLAELLCQQCAELIENLVLALAYVFLCLVVLLLVYVLYVQQQ